MANSFLGSPPLWALDTQSATPVSTDQLRIFRIKWVIAAGAVLTDRCILTDQNGKTIFDDAPNTTTTYDSGDLVFPEKSFTINGLIVSTLTRGIVYVYLR